MVFKSESILERLKRLEEVIARLSRYRGQTSEDFLMDAERQWLVERGFIIAAECVGDIATHILSAKFKIQPADHEDAIRRLGLEGVISQALTQGLRGLGGFRNILVHGYLRVDPTKVHEHLEGSLEPLQEFVAQVAAWITTK